MGGGSTPNFSRIPADGLQHAHDGTIGAVPASGKPAQTVEVTEELVSAVDEVNDHVGSR
jgi:hypothetical protein